MKKIGFVLLGVLGVYALIYTDVMLRAKGSYAEAEKYMEWHENPQSKRATLETEFQKEKEKLERNFSQKKISQEEYAEELKTLEFDKNYQLEESSLKYAYQWYKDTYELFSPPESKWVKMAKIKAPQALELWKQELREKKIPFQDTMVE